MPKKRAAVKTDVQLRREMLDERDPIKLVELVYGYYRDTDRAARTSREWLFFDLGRLSMTIVQLAKKRNTKTVCK